MFLVRVIFLPDSRLLIKAVGEENRPSGAGFRGPDLQVCAAARIPAPQLFGQMACEIDADQGRGRSRSASRQHCRQPGRRRCSAIPPGARLP